MKAQPYAVTAVLHRSPGGRRWGQMHSGCVAELQELLPSDTAMLQNTKPGKEVTTSRVGTQHSSLQPQLVEERHFKQPSTFTSVEVMLVAPHGAQQIHWCPEESAQLSRGFLHRLNYLGSEPLVQCTNHLNVSLAVTE